MFCFASSVDLYTIYVFIPCMPSSFSLLLGVIKKSSVVGNVMEANLSSITKDGKFSPFAAMSVARHQQLEYVECVQPKQVQLIIL